MKISLVKNVWCSCFYSEYQNWLQLNEKFLILITHENWCRKWRHLVFLVHLKIKILVLLVQQFLVQLIRTEFWSSVHTGLRLRASLNSSSSESFKRQHQKKELVRKLLIEHRISRLILTHSTLTKVTEYTGSTVLENAVTRQEIAWLALRFSGIKWTKSINAVNTKKTRCAQTCLVISSVDFYSPLHRNLS